MRKIIDLISNAYAIIEKYLIDMLQNPLKHGTAISYSIICFGAAIWLVMFSINFVMTALGL